MFCFRHVECGSVVYIDGFRGYRRVPVLGYGHLSVRHSDGVCAVGHVRVDGAESRNWYLRAFLFFKRVVSLKYASFYASAASAFVGPYADAALQACHWLSVVISHVA